MGTIYSERRAGRSDGACPDRVPPGSPAGPLRPAGPPGERTREGLEAARARGQRLGWPPALSAQRPDRPLRFGILLAEDPSAAGRSVLIQLPCGLVVTELWVAPRVVVTRTVSG